MHPRRPTGERPATVVDPPAAEREVTRLAPVAAVEGGRSRTLEIGTLARPAAPPPRATDPDPAPAIAGAAEPSKRLADFSLVTVEGREPGQVFIPRSDCVVIGSHPSADLVLRDPAVSRFHCEITVADPPTVRDLGSRNGTMVNGVTVAQAPLGDGALLTVGGTQLRLQRTAGAPRIVLSERDRFGRMIGHSAAMRAVFALCEQAAASDATVLIEGETGTGKEATAEAIHRESARRDGPFVVVDCGAIPPQLLESELFGHERGAFTGAVAQRQGAFQAAAGGTIFLDEIGELALDLQPKILRALEQREVKPVGVSHYASVDVRVMAATNRNLREEVTARRFRSDLYYRLAVLRVRLPPLRERKEDLGLLVEHLLAALGATERPEAQAMRSESFLNEVARHAWPGNVRELRNYVERCLTTREAASPPELELLPEAAAALKVDVGQPFKAAREAWMNAFERRYVTELLRIHQDNVTVAARAAGVDRVLIYRLLWKHGLRAREAPRGRPSEE